MNTPKKIGNMTVKRIRKLLFPKLSKFDFEALLWEETSFPCSSPKRVFEELSKIAAENDLSCRPPRRRGGKQ